MRYQGIIESDSVLSLIANRLGGLRETTANGPVDARLCCVLFDRYGQVDTLAIGKSGEILYRGHTYERDKHLLQDIVPYLPQQHQHELRKMMQI